MNQSSRQSNFPPTLKLFFGTQLVEWARIETWKTPMTETEWGWWVRKALAVLSLLWLLTEALSSPSVIPPQAWRKPGLVCLSVAVLQLCKISDLTLTSCETCSAVVRQGTGAELSRKAPRLHTMIYSLGLPQKQEISHRVERSSHYSCIWRHVQPHMILIKPPQVCKCNRVHVWFFFTVIYFLSFVFLYVCIAVWGLSIPESIVFSEVWDEQEMRLMFFSEKSFFALISSFICNT